MILWSLPITKVDAFDKIVINSDAANILRVRFRGGSLSGCRTRRSCQSHRRLPETFRRNKSGSAEN